MDEYTEREAVARAALSDPLVTKREARTSRLACALICEVRDQREHIHGLTAERDRIANVLRSCRALLRHPDNGAVYCRWCGRSIADHDVHCSYVSRCKAIDEARAEADAALTPAGTEAHDRNDDPACLSCGHVSTDHPQGRRCGATGEDGERCGCLQLRMPEGTEAT